MESSKQINPIIGSISIDGIDLFDEGYPNPTYVEFEEYLFEHLKVIELLEMLNIEPKELENFDLGAVSDQKCKVLFTFSCLLSRWLW